jgi:chromosome segregation protein
MRLSQLDIKGFKSFATDTVIHFNEDVIGIVGPNGSGKSNIVDAVRWVLGEQKSRELRLDKMVNVIFNGTKKRRAGALAQVSLTFENTRNLLPTEYHTITITRTLYRSGESEYRLNNVPCRLKDITSLFLDTGIGSNSYAIIALGMVDDILADKENARRRMFEQAAGISKYKIRKRETLLKLKRTEADLDRIEDLLFEIEGNLKSLEKQARRTKRFFELKEIYKQLSISLATHQLTSFKTDYQSVEQKMTAEKDKQSGIDGRIQKLEAEVEATRKANLDKEKALTDRQRDLNKLVGEIRNKENEKSLLNEKLSFAEKSRKQLEKQLEEAAGRMEKYQREIESYALQLQEEKKQEQRVENELEAAEKQLEEVKNRHGGLKSDLDSFLEGQKKLDHEIFELEKRKAVLTNQLDTFKSELVHLEEEGKQRESTVAELEKSLKELEEERKARESEVEKLELEEIKRQNSAEQLEEELEKVRRKINNVNRKLDARRNEYQLTQNMIENLEGFPESIKFLNKNKSWGLEAPLLSDLIYTKEEFRIAIENYLDPYLNYYVVPTLKDARKAISLLSDAQKGKANFFILEAFESYDPAMFLFPETTQAIDLVECDPPYRKMVSYLLERVIISEREELPEKLAAEDLTVIARSGRFVQRRFSLSGGSIGLFEGKKIGRKKNLEMLESQIKQAEREEDKLSSSVYRIKNKLEKLKSAAHQPQINEAKKLLNQLDQRKVSLMTRLENAENFLRSAKEKKEVLLKSSTETREEIRDIDLMLNNLMEQVEKSREDVSKMSASYREAADQLGDASQGFNQKNISLIRQQNKVTALQRELNFREKQLEETRFQRSRDEQSIGKNRQEQEDLKQAVEQLEAELLTAYQHKSEKSASLSEAEQGYFKARGAITELEDKLRKENRLAQQSRELYSDLKDRFNEIKMQISSIAERIRIEFGLTANELINKTPDDQNPEEVKEKVEKLKNRLDNYGEINPLAVEAYDEMKERYESIKAQRDDILEAKDSLNETIKEIEATATQQFLASFEKARNYFIDVFRSLFTENDTCDLILLDPENPLESNIEIIAKPKGKRPQSISQLSGGEKTLTATALLFALYLLKPAPFCIFDEVDAPLDDANIEKFNRIIKKFSKDSQFIIVTHNKMTMAAVDVIYGVYMEEAGVSAVSPVDFRTLENNVTLIEG